MHEAPLLKVRYNPYEIQTSDKNIVEHHRHYISLTENRTPSFAVKARYVNHYTIREGRCVRAAELVGDAWTRSAPAESRVAPVQLPKMTSLTWNNHLLHWRTE